VRRYSALLALCCAFALAACHPREADAPAPKPVVAIPAHPDGRPPLATLTCDVEARYSTPLSFRVGGNIVERLVRLGDSVKAGQVVARLDPTDARNNLTKARAELDAAEHQLAYAEQQLERNRAQQQQNLIAQKTWEETQDAYAQATAQRDSALASLELASDQLAYTTLNADHAGVIAAETADTGQNVNAGETIYNLAWTGDVDVVCDASDRDLDALEVGRKASVSLVALPDRKFAARVREVAPAADQSSRTYRVKLTLQAPDPAVHLGMTAEVAFAAVDETSDQPVFTLPATALFHDGERPAVWVVRAGTDTLELRPVSVARYDERTVSVVGGLHDGERVVLEGVHTVSAGESVRVVTPLRPEEFAS
jgi:RND family efflux transporter MFP subunit